MRDWGPTVACALLVLAMGWGARRVATSAWESVVRYRTPYRFHARLPGGPRLVQRVILVTIDGLRLGYSHRLNFLNELRRQGADGQVRAAVPSLTNPGRATLVTGAWAEVHGITSNFALQRVEADSVFSLAHAAGLRTAVAGAPFWYRGFAPHVDELLRGAEEPRFLPPNELLQWQQQQCAEGLEFVESAQFDFLTLDWTAGDTASHDYGALSSNTERIFTTIDDCLRNLVASQDLTRTVIIVTSDHGHIDRGGHGGSEPEVLEVPLALVGGPVRAGVQFRAQQVDVAPTICALLGLPFPATNEGAMLLDELRLDPDLRGSLLARQRQQQNKFASFRGVVLVGTKEQAVPRARQGRSRTAELAGLTLVALLLWLFVGVLASPAQWRGALGALAVFYLAYWFLFNQFGLGYSLSAVNRDEYLASFFLKDMLLAGAALLAANFIMGLLSRPAGREAYLRLPAAATLLISLSLTARVSWAHWWEGLWMTQWMPDLNVLFRAYLDLLALSAFSFAIWATPLAAWAGARLRRRH